nr:hypothetical protein CTI12_AA202190 [Tanacetum cinerariifolium]
MDLNIDLRYLLLPLATLLIPFSLYAYATFTIFLLFVSIKLPLRLQLLTGVRLQPIDLSVSLMVCFFSFIFMSTPHFWIVNSILMLCASRWDNVLVNLLKLCFWWLYRTWKDTCNIEFLCILSRHEMEEAELNQSVEELSYESCDEDADHADLEAGVELS